jgi:signal transduction histidine kinase
MSEITGGVAGAPEVRGRWWSEWPSLLVLWTIVGLVFGTEEYIAAHAFGAHITWSQAVNYALPAWYLWAVMTPLMLLLARRYPIRRGGATYALVMHLTASALLSLVHTAMTIAVLQWLEPSLLHGLSYQEALRERLRFASQLDMVTYWVVIGVAHAVAFYKRQTERELQSMRLSASLAEARLQVLRMELNPHFLFNTLNAISGFVYSDPRAADRMIARLGELLRLSLATPNAVTLAQELRLLECYVDIERVRFGDRLTISSDTDDLSLTAVVPSLILQPIVENAVRHGLQPNGAGGRIEVHARTINDMVEIVVKDDGVGFDGNASRERAAAAVSAEGTGLGLANTRQRLHAMYSERASLDISADGGHGTVVTLHLPLVTNAA